LNAVTFTFDFGDVSAPVSGQSPLAFHTYEDPGLYTILLTVSDGHGHVDSDSQSVTIP
jgi:PKD repeat protein